MSDITVQVQLEDATPVDVTVSPAAGVAFGFGAYKAPVRAASTANVTLGSPVSSVDGVTLNVGDRVLLKNQSTGSQNGVYVQADSGELVRAPDADQDGELIGGSLVPVTEGTTNADTVWLLATNNPIEVGTTSLTFVTFGGGGSLDENAVKSIINQATVVHDDDPDVARPSGFSKVFWHGSVEPANATDLDEWTQTESS